MGIRVRNHCATAAQKHWDTFHLVKSMRICSIIVHQNISNGNISGFCKVEGLSRANNLFLPSYNPMYSGLPWDPSRQEVTRYVPLTGTTETQRLMKLRPDCVQGMFRSPLRSPPAFTSGDPCGANLIYSCLCRRDIQITLPVCVNSCWRIDEMQISLLQFKPDHCTWQPCSNSSCCIHIVSTISLCSLGIHDPSWSYKSYNKNCPRLFQEFLQKRGQFNHFPEQTSTTLSM